MLVATVEFLAEALHHPEAKVSPYRLRQVWPSEEWIEIDEPLQIRKLDWHGDVSEDPI